MISEQTSALNQRNFGLDAIRALAIILVFIQHMDFSFIRTSEEYTKFAFLYSGTIGVEIFFTLSGFLIGNILLKISDYNFRSLFTFYKRRWLRTLPLYYLVLLMNICIFLPPISILPQFFWFLQNNYLIHTPEPVFFPVSWSLSVEEWYYLIIPLLYFLSSKIVPSKFIRVFILLALSVIIHLWLGIKYEFLIAEQRSIAYLHFDALLVGFFFASSSTLKNFFQKVFENNYIAVIFNLSFGILFSAILIALAYLKPGGLTAISLIITSILCGVFIYSFYFLPEIRSLKFLSFLAKISYPFYLVHQTIVALCSKLFTVSGLNIIILTILSFGLSVLVSYILNYFVEEPIMKYRNKSVPQK